MIINKPVYKTCNWTNGALWSEYYSVNNSFHGVESRWSITGKRIGHLTWNNSKRNGISVQFEHVLYETNF